MKYIAVSLFLLFTFAVLPSSVSAKRVVPQAQKAAVGTAKPAVTTRGVSSAVKFRGDRKGINVTFSNFAIASSVSYSLVYETNGAAQGVNGSIPLTESSVNRDIIFGSCSTNNVCRYDTGVKNAKFVVTTSLKSGKKVIKTYRLRV